MIFLFKAMRLGNAIKAIVVGITELNSSGWNSDRKEKTSFRMEQIKGQRGFSTSLSGLTSKF